MLCVDSGNNGMCYHYKILIQLYMHHFFVRSNLYKEWLSLMNTGSFSFDHSFEKAINNCFEKSTLLTAVGHT